MADLRDYQINDIDALRQAMASGNRSVLYVLPTGGGKTLSAAHMLHACTAKAMRSIFVVHRQELINQSTRAFTGEGVPHGIIAAGYDPAPYRPVQIASVQTLHRRLERIQEPNLIVWDECHHLGARSWQKVFRAFPKAFHVGLTASPIRLDGQGLGRFFKVMIQGPTTAELIERGFLSDYRVFIPGSPDLSRVATVAGDFDKGQLEVALDKPTITGSALTEYVRHARGERAIVFAVSINHSKHVVSQFSAAGFRAAHIDGETPREERAGKVKAFEQGEIQILSNVDLINEGFNVEAIRCAILLRPTQSVGLYLQQVGRALRAFPGKRHAIILDHAGNCERHGLPCEDRHWSLDDRQRRAKSDGKPALKIRICPKCRAGLKAGVITCRHCGYVFEGKPRAISEVEGDLVEIDPKEKRLARLKEERECRTEADLAALGRQRNYRFPERWAFLKMKHREAKRRGYVGGR